MPIASKYDNTGATTLEQILLSKTEFVVPKFQRNYSWSDEKVDRLWADIMENFVTYLESTDPQEAQYLMGPVVFVKKDNKFQVIDGQQRLATITILFCIVRDLMIELVPIEPGVTAPEGLAKVKELIETRKLGNRLFWTLTLNDSDKKLFKQIQEYEESNWKTPSDRIKEWKKDLRDPVKKNGYTESMRKIIKTYQLLYEKIQESLITNFESEKNAELIIGKIETAVENEASDAMKNDPEEYGLPADYFDTLNSLDQFVIDAQNNNLGEEDKEKFETELETRNRSRTANPFADVNELLEDIKKRHMKKYNDILKQEVENLKIKKTKDQRVSHIPKLNSFLEHIQQNNFLVRIIVEDDSDAFQIFETLNERGQTLSKSNLIKNHVISNIPEEAAQTDLSDDWNKIFDETIGDKQGDDDFLRESLRSRYFDKHPLPNISSDVKASKNNLYKIIKTIVTDATSARNYVGTLKADAEFTHLLNDPTAYPDEDTKRAIFAIKALDAIAIRTPILTAYRRWSTDHDAFRKLVKFLVKFFFRYRTISQRHPGKIDSLMIGTAEKIKDGKDVDDIIKDLKDEDNPDDFRYDFINKFEPKKDAYAKYVLQEITIKLGSKYSDVQPEDSLTLEHILPQKPDKTDWKENDFFNGYTGDETQKKFEKFIYKLGNLTLLKFVINSAIKNKSFDKKKNYVDAAGHEKGYNSSQLEINLKTVMTETEWTAKIIEDRTENFADLAEKIWSLD